MTTSNATTVTTGSGETTGTTKRARDTFSHRTLTDAQITKLDTLKTKAALLWDEIDTIVDSSSVSTVSFETARLVSLAKTELENTILWAVKAVSRQ